MNSYVFCSGLLYTLIPYIIYCREFENDSNYRSESEHFNAQNQRNLQSVISTVVLTEMNYKCISSNKPNKFSIKILLTVLWAILMYCLSLRVQKEKRLFPVI